MLPVIGLVSAFAEGPLGERAVQSLHPAVERVYVAEGPAGDPGQEVNHRWPSMKKTHVAYGAWDSDADKRTYLIREAQRYVNGKPFWAVWLDADEVLVNAENLPVWIRRAEYGDPDLRATGGFYIRRVELDGTTVQCPDRVIRGDQIHEYVHSIVEIRLKRYDETGDRASLSLGHLPNWTPGVVHELPDGSTTIIPGDPVTAYNRPPLQGEPHVLHLHELRDPARTAQRLSDAEVDGYREQAKRIGVMLPEWVGQP